MKASFIIPARNEEHDIQATISSIQEQAEIAFEEFEIIVADHGSTDDTRKVSTSSGASVLNAETAGTIAELRNIGAQRAQHPLLIFLDADTRLLSPWGELVREKYTDIVSKNIITGAHVFPDPGSRNWFNRYWFHSFSHDPRNTHIGSAHMIMSAATFTQLDGFDSNLETGEDYEICERALKSGMQLLPDLKLICIHKGFPTSIGSFMRREMWHSLGDYRSLSSLFGSKVALGTVMFALLHLLLLTGLMLGNMPWMLAAGGMIVLLLLSSSYYKFNHSGLTTILVNSAIFYLYYLGRLLGPLLIISGKRNN